MIFGTGCITCLDTVSPIKACSHTYLFHLWKTSYWIFLLCFWGSFALANIIMLGYFCSFLQTLLQRLASGKTIFSVCLFYFEPGIGSVGLIFSAVLHHLANTSYLLLSVSELCLLVLMQWKCSPVSIGLYSVMFFVLFMLLANLICPYPVPSSPFFVFVCMFFDLS